MLLEGRGGLDRSLRALVGVDVVSLAPLFPGADGLSLTFAAGGARLLRGPTSPSASTVSSSARAAISLHGDVIETTGTPPLRLEVE